MITYESSHRIVLDNLEVLHRIGRENLWVSPYDSPSGLMGTPIGYIVLLGFPLYSRYSHCTPRIPIVLPGFPLYSRDFHRTPGISIVLPRFLVDFQGFGIQKVRRFPPSPSREILDSLFISEKSVTNK